MKPIEEKILQKLENYNHFTTDINLKNCAKEIAALILSKERVIEVLERRKKVFRYQIYEDCEMAKAIDIINRLVPPECFASELGAEKEEREERFKRPTDNQTIEIAILFNNGKLQKHKLSDMVAMADFIIDRLYENGDVTIKSSKEED